MNLADKFSELNHAWRTASVTDAPRARHAFAVFCDENFARIEEAIRFSADPLEAALPAAPVILPLVPADFEEAACVLEEMADEAAASMKASGESHDAIAYQQTVGWEQGLRRGAARLRGVKIDSVRKFADREVPAPAGARLDRAAEEIMFGYRQRHQETHSQAMQFDFEFDCMKAGLERALAYLRGDPEPAAHVFDFDAFKMDMGGKFGAAVDRSDMGCIQIDCPRDHFLAAMAYAMKAIPERTHWRIENIAP